MQAAPSTSCPTAWSKGVFISIRKWRDSKGREEPGGSQASETCLAPRQQLGSFHLTNQRAQQDSGCLEELSCLGAFGKQMNLEMKAKKDLEESLSTWEAPAVPGGGGRDTACSVTLLRPDPSAVVLLESVGHIARWYNLPFLLWPPRVNGAVFLSDVNQHHSTGLSVDQIPVWCNTITPVKPITELAPWYHSFGINGSSKPVGVTLKRSVRDTLICHISLYQLQTWIWVDVEQVGKTVALSHGPLHLWQSRHCGDH